MFFNGSLNVSAEKVGETLSFLLENNLYLLFLSVGQVEIDSSGKFFAIGHREKVSLSIINVTTLSLQIVRFLMSPVRPIKE